MTVKELYEYAEQYGLLDYEIEIQYRDDGGVYTGSSNELYLEKNDLLRILVL